MVLEGELQVTDIDLETGKELSNRVRVAGDFAYKEPGDVHMEQAGTNGALVLFSIYDTNGEVKLAEALTEGGKIMSTSTIKSILNRRGSAMNRRSNYSPPIVWLIEHFVQN